MVPGTAGRPFFLVIEREYPVPRKVGIQHTAGHQQGPDKKPAQLFVFFKHTY